MKHMELSVSTFHGGICSTAITYAKTVWAPAQATNTAATPPGFLMWILYHDIAATLTAVLCSCPDIITFLSATSLHLQYAQKTTQQLLLPSCVIL